ncbi:DUF58 domain-containing protein [Brevibacterium samyangense]|uniref:DUF58 domain-containing protein n=1 Tax=Brevibacterium samyangense TaxID=366888 RepID=A0ABN2TLU1_9MICO
MAALLTKVKARMTFHAHRKTRGLLEGEYASVFHGHSMDFDDLREYVPGDEIRDIDWKATARHSTPLVKRYVAHRRHALALLVDTGANLDAVSESGEPKRELAIMLAGMAGYLAVRNGDDVMLIEGDAAGTRYSERKGTEAHLEHLLRRIQGAGTRPAVGASVGVPGPESGPRGGAPRPPEAPAGSDIAVQLRWAAEHLRRRMLLLVIADDVRLAGLDPTLLTRLGAQHELMWMTMADADLSTFAGANGTPYEVTDSRSVGVPDELLVGDDLWKEYRTAETARIAANEEVLRRNGVAHVRVGSTGDALIQLRRLMRRQRRGRN